MTMMLQSVVILSLMALQGIALASTAPPPSIWHLHLALSSDPTRMFVQWTTSGPQAAVVAWGTSPTSLPSTFSGNTWSYTDSQSRTYYFANASMTQLAPGGVYFYKVGDGVSNWSPVKSFTATRSREQFSTENPLKVAWLGDLGYSNGQATPFLLAAAAAKEFDHFTHVGDYAYDLPNNNGTVGDMFESSIEGITSTTAYEGCEGNHEGGGEFGHYANRFGVYAGDNSSGATPQIAGLIPAPYNNHWYSYEVGLVHFVAMSSEAYFFYQGAEAQYAWMEADLAAVDRSVTPWVVVYGHRSIYCSCDGDCDGAATTLRDGINGQYGMEALLNKHKVDLWINAHEHDYERNYAVLDHKLATGASSGKPGDGANPEVLEDPTAPIYIIEGCAGDSEGHEPFTREQPVYSAFRSNTYGYGRMTVYNATTLLWEQIQTDNEPVYANTTGTVIDAMVIVKSK